MCVCVCVCEHPLIDCYDYLQMEQPHALYLDSQYSQRNGTCGKLERMAKCTNNELVGFTQISSINEILPYVG